VATSLAQDVLQGDALLQYAVPARWQASLA